MNTKNPSLGHFLKSMRAEKGMSLRDFSHYLGISHAYLNKLEKGVDSRTGKEITPTIETLTKIADGMNISTKKFLEMCGYFEITSSDLQEPHFSSIKRLNIDVELTQLIISIEEIEEIYYNNFPITSEEKNNITTTLRSLSKNLWLKYRDN